jgi:hypothetical protein
LRGSVEFHCFAYEARTWTNQEHLASGDVEELGKFVKGVPPKKSPDARHSRITFHLEESAAGIVQILKPVS